MPPRSGRATIREVAAAANVSTQTVSRVINNRPDVSPQTRKHIQSIIEQMGYQPSALARSLIRQRSYMLGVVTAGLSYLGPSQALSGIAAAAEAAGYALLLKELSRFDAGNTRSIFQVLLSHHVDGIIWAVPEVGDNRNWVNHIPIDLNVPVVYLTMEPKQNISVVSINNYLGGRMAMSHLLEQGYRHIGHISGPLDWWEARQRMNAWRDALAEAGLEASDRHWVEGNWSSSSGAQGAETLLARYPEIDAIFSGNDQMALGVMQTAASRRLDIPQDLGIVGFDNITESAFFQPSLTTIHQDLDSLGRLALEEIIKIIEAGWQEEEPLEPNRSILLAPTLIVRQSSLHRQGQRKVSKK